MESSYSLQSIISNTSKISKYPCASFVSIRQNKNILLTKMVTWIKLTKHSFFFTYENYAVLVIDEDQFHYFSKNK